MNHILGNSRPFNCFKNIPRYFLGHIRVSAAVPQVATGENWHHPLWAVWFLRLVDGCSSLGVDDATCHSSGKLSNSEVQSKNFSMCVFKFQIKKKMFTGSAWVECWCDWDAILRKATTFCISKTPHFFSTAALLMMMMENKLEKTKAPRDNCPQKKFPAFLPCLRLHSKRVWKRLVLLKWPLWGKEKRQCECESLPCLSSKQLVVVGGALVVILPVPDDRGQAFTDQRLCNVAEGGRREKKWGRVLNEISGGRGRVSRGIPIEVCSAAKKIRGMTNPKGCAAGEQRSPKCWHFTLD